MSKKQKIADKYHSGKDKWTIKIKRFALTKKARDEVLDGLVAIIQQNLKTKAGAAERKTKIVALDFMSSKSVGLPHPVVLIVAGQ